MWNNFPETVMICSLLWMLGVVAVSFSNKSKVLKTGGITLLCFGSCVLLYFIFNLWNTLERPPLRTLGETRLLYAAFMSLIGIALYLRWQYRWLLLYSIFFAILFLGINLARPEVQNKTLMPALHSPWFVPHVVVYIFSYAMLGAASLAAMKGLYDHYKKRSIATTHMVADNLVYIGFAFLTLGLLFGALWAKEAWGHYWTWDPKETWAFITWVGYLIYLHLRFISSVQRIVQLRVLVAAFILLLICWFGVAYLPSAQTSIHVYTE